MFFSNFVDVYKSCNTFEKKIFTAKLLYSFYPEDYKIKTDAIKLMKLRLDNLGLFIQFLGIIVQEEVEVTEENFEMISEIKYYASSAIGARSPSIRISALSIMNHLVELDFEYVQGALIKFIGTVSYNDWWEVRVMYLVVMSSVIRKLVSSDPYKAFIKKETQTIGRTMNDDAEFLVKNIRELFDKVATSFRQVVCKNFNTHVTKIALIYYCDLISENKNLASVYIDLLLQAPPNERQMALQTEELEEFEYQEERYFILSPNSHKYKTHIRNYFLKEASGEILMQLSKKLKGISVEEFGMNYVDVLIFSLENAEFDKLNIEILDSLIGNSLDLILNSLKNPEMMNFTRDILTKFLDTFLKGEAPISEFDQRLSDNFADVFNTNDDEVIAATKEMLSHWAEEYNEESALFEQFSKIIGKIIRKAQVKIENKEHGDWMKEVFKVHRDGLEFEEGE